MPDRMLTTTEVQELTGLGRTTIWRLERDGDFPRRRQITPNRVGWLASEVDDWLQTRPVANAGAASDA